MKVLGRGISLSDRRVDAMRILSVSLLCLLTSCATEQELYRLEKNNPGIDIESRRDPFKVLNRQVLRFNIAMDKYLVRNFAGLYKGTVHKNVRSRISNFLHNLHQPFSAVFHLLAFDIDGAAKASWRFLMNTTFGFLGIGDPAADIFGITVKEYSFSDSLKKWGVNGKPYIVLPIIGPSSPRDIVGLVGDIFLDPLHYIYPKWFRYAQKPIDVVTERAENWEAVDTLLYKSIDPYLNIRNAYLNNPDDPIIEDDELDDL